MPGSAKPHMTTDPDHSGSLAEPPISDSVARQIASCFRLPVDEVVLDAQQVSTWSGPADELLVWLEQRHRWRARGALAYLLSLRRALHLGSGDGSSR